jgi:glutamyl-tRNA reductase
MAHLFRDVVGIITATAAPHPLVYARHIEGARKPLTIIDLGVPSDCEEAVTQLDHVCYMSLQDIEARAQTNLEERRCRARTAARIIHDGALAWAAKR